VLCIPACSVLQCAFCVPLCVECVRVCVCACSVCVCARSVCSVVCVCLSSCYLENLIDEPQLRWRDVIAKIGVGCS